MQQAHLDSLARICARHAGSDCQVRPLEELVGSDWGRSTVWRCSYAAATGMEGTVIAKYSNLGEQHGANEAQVLTRLQLDEELTGRLPRLLGYDEALQLLALSDLGQIRDQRLADWRDKLAPADFMDLLLELMKLLGSLNRLNPASAPAWRDCPPLCPATDLTGHAAVGLLDSLANLPARFAAQSIELNAAALAELAMFERLLTQTDHHCLTHADICRSNVAVLDGRLLIFDFEVSALRHPAIDAAWARIRSLRCFHCTILAAEDILRLEQCWAEGYHWTDSDLARHCSFGMLISAGCLAWLAAMLDWLPDLADKDRERERVSDRVRILASLEAIQGCETQYSCLPCLAGCCRSLSDQLSLRWPAAAGSWQNIKPKFNQ